MYRLVLYVLVALAADRRGLWRVRISCRTIPSRSFFPSPCSSPSRGSRTKFSRTPSRRKPTSNQPISRRSSSPSSYRPSRRATSWASRSSSGPRSGQRHRNIFLPLNKKHLFNPAAFAVALTALTINQSATWWIGGNLPMMAFVDRRRAPHRPEDPARRPHGRILRGGSRDRDPRGNPRRKSFHHARKSGPARSPLFLCVRDAHRTFDHAADPRAAHRLWRFRRGPLCAVGPYRSLYSTPELALLAGNILAYFLSPKSKHILKLKKIEEVGTGMYDFVFEKPPLAVQAGTVSRMDAWAMTAWTAAATAATSRSRRRPQNRISVLALNFTTSRAVSKRGCSK